MYSPLDASWDNLIRSGSNRKTVIDIYQDPALLVPTLSDIPLERFSIKVDRNSNIRRTGEATVIDSDLLGELTRSGSSLEPYGSEVRVRTGLRLSNGSYAMVPVGVFQIEDLRWNEDESSIQMSLFDRSKALERSSYGVPIDASGKQALAFIQDVITDLMPYVTFNFAASNFDIRFPGGTTFRSGRLAAVEEAAQVLGCEFFFDVNGTARVVPTPYIDQTTLSSQYDWLVNVGEDGVLVSYARGITRKDTFNKIHVWGAPATESTPQPYGFAVDDNPSSPTYYGGRFGKADTRVERQELTTAGQCTTFALAQLRNSVGLSRSVNMNSLCNPALDAGDKILVRYLDGSQELHLVDSLGFDQTGGMSIETRVQMRR